MKSLKQYIKEEEENFHVKEIEALTKSVGGGTASAGVFESWVHIVSSIGGNRRKPTVAEVNSARGHGEFNKEGEKWLKDVAKFGTKDRKFDDDKVLQAIYYIGGNVKDVQAISWPPADIIHNNITKQYYNKLPKIWKTEKTKQNTADIVFITKGTAKALSKALPNCTEEGSIAWNDPAAEGKCSIPAVPGIEWYQVSLKKGIDDARIGKLGAWLKGKYAKAGYSPDVSKLPQTISDAVIQRENYLGVSYGFDDRIDQILLDEGLFDIFKAVKDKVVGSFKKLADWAAGKLRKTIGRILGSIRKIMSSNPVIDNANEILSIAGVRNLGEEVLLEKENVEIVFKKPAAKALLLKKFEIFEKQLSSGMVNKEYEKVKTTIAALDAKKSTLFTKGKVAVMLKANDADAKIPEHQFAGEAAIIINKLKDSIKYGAVTTKDLFLPLKIASHYTAYNAINVILTDIGQNIKEEHGGVMMAAMGFVADTKTEAKFGNTKLPLYIVYGSKNGHAEYLGTKDTFKPLEFNELINNPFAKKLDQPFVVIRIESVSATAATYNLKGHNVTEVYLMSGIDEQKELPKYLLLNFTTSSGSKFTMKPEVEKELAKSWY